MATSSLTNAAIPRSDKTALEEVNLGGGWIPSKSDGYRYRYTTKVGCINWINLIKPYKTLRLYNLEDETILGGGPETSSNRHNDASKYSDSSDYVTIIMFDMFNKKQKTRPLTFSSQPQDVLRFYVSMYNP